MQLTRPFPPAACPLRSESLGQSGLPEQGQRSGEASGSDGCLCAIAANLLVPFCPPCCCKLLQLWLLLEGIGMPDVDSASCRCKNNCQWQQYACCMLCCMLLTCQSLSWSLTLRASGWITAFPAPAGGLASTDITTAHVEVTGQPCAHLRPEQAGGQSCADAQAGAPREHCFNSQPALAAAA